MSQVPVYSIFKVHEAAPDCGWERTPSLTLNKEAIFEGVFQKRLKSFFVPLGKQKSRPSENGKAALRLNDLLVHIYIVYCGQAYGRRARAMTNGSNRSKEIKKQARSVLPDFCLHNEMRSVQTKTGIAQGYLDFSQGCSVSSSAFTLYMGDDTR